MTVGVKYQRAIKAFMEGKHSLDSAVLALCLSNRAPDVVNDEFLSDAVEIANGNGYTTGGKILALTSSAQAAGLYKAIYAVPPVWTAAGGVIGPFRYIIVVNQSTGGSPLAPAAIRLLDYYDYGLAITLAVGESFAPTPDVVAGLIQGQ